MKGITRIKILSVVFVLLCIVAWFALQEKFSNDTITKGEENKIAIADTASIQKVTIEKNGKTQVITRDKEGWMINGKYRTAFRPSALMLLGLNQIQIKRPVSEESKQKVYQEVTQRGAKVTVENAEGSHVLWFLSNPGDPNTTYLIASGSQTPYVAYVPGIRGDINNLFNLSEIDWRVKKLFASQPNAIEKLKVAYPSDPQGSFEIVYQKGRFSIPGFPNADSSKILNYLSLYRNAPLITYLTDKKDSADALLNKAQLLAKIDLADLDERKNAAVEVYRDPQNSKEYLGRLPATGEPVLLDKGLFDALMIKKNYFQKR